MPNSSTATPWAGATRIPGLFFESERWPDEVHITLALRDGPIDREPAAHACTIRFSLGLRF